MNQKGFTLLEIIVALAILSVSLVVISDLHNSGMLRSRRAEDITTASMLARLKLHEVQLEIENNMAKGEFPAENKHDEGKFDEPYEKFSWSLDIKKVDIPVPPQPEGGGEGEEGAADQAGMGVMFQIFKMISEKIAESARELKLEVKWNELEEEQSLSVSTHVVKM